MSKRKKFRLPKSKKRERSNRKVAALNGVNGFTASLSAIGATLSIRGFKSNHWLIFLSDERRIEWWPTTGRCVVHFDYGHAVTCETLQDVLALAGDETERPSAPKCDLDGEFSDRISRET